MLKAKKLLTIILAFCMVFTVMGTVFAAGTDYEQLQAAVKAVRDARDSSHIYISVEGFEVCNDMTADEFLKLVKKYIIPEGNETEATLYTEDDYRIHNATAEKEGYIDCNVNFVCGDRSQKEGVTVKIPKLTGEAAYKSEDRVNIEADKAAIKEYMKKVSTTNDTTNEKLLNGIKTAVVNGSEVSWDEFDKKEATENHTGYIKGTIKLVLNSEEETVTINQAILKVNYENPQVEKIPMPGNDANNKKDDSKIPDNKKDDNKAPDNKKADFDDVKANEYYADAVNWAVAQNITAGTSANTFSPDDTCTRAQILTFLWRASGSPKASAKNSFTDVSESDYYYDAAVWASEKGMVIGTKFEADTPCTRSATVMYLWQNEGSPEVDAKQRFSDVPTVENYAAAVCWAVNNGITSGTSDTTFSPDDICSRGQIVTFLFRTVK